MTQIRRNKKTKLPSVKHYEKNWSSPRNQIDNRSWQIDYKVLCARICWKCEVGKEMRAEDWIWSSNGKMPFTSHKISGNK